MVVFYSGWQYIYIGRAYYICINILFVVQQMIKLGFFANVTTLPKVNCVYKSSFAAGQQQSFCGGIQVTN